MASNSIKGLTVKIGADTSDFIKGLKAVDREINQTQKTANSLQKGLKLDYNEKNFLQAQKQVQSALSTTEEKAKAIRQQMETLEKSGNIDTDGYRRLETELSKSETKASQLRNQLEELDKIKLDNANKSVEKLSKGFENAAQKTAVFSAAAVGAIAGINKLGSDAAAKGGEIQDFADRLGISAESIQRYNYIALQSGVETEQLVKSIAKSRDAIGTAMSGTVNTSTKALQVLFGDLDTIPQNAEEGFSAIIEQLSKVEDSTLQAYYANEIFGERLATNLIPLINNGADRLNQLNAEFEAIGYLSNDQVQALADFDDELNIMRERMELAKTEMGIALIPIMERFVDLLENNVIPAIKGLSDWFDSLSAPMQGVFTNGLLLVAALSPVLLIISKIIGIIPELKKGLDWLKTTAGQTALGFAALAGAIGLAFDLIGNWKQMSTIEKILKSLAVAALVAAAAVTVFHSSWSLGLAIGSITAGVVAGIAAIKAAGEKIGVETDFNDIDSLSSSASSGNYNIPESTGNYGSYTDNTSSYIDNSNVVINIEQNEYMTEDDIIRAVNQGLKQARQARA